LLVSFSNLFFYYFLALRRSWIMIPAALGPLTGMILCFINHNRIEDIINNFFIASLVTFLILSLGVVREILNKKHGK
jgi:hypothetical protein